MTTLFFVVEFDLVARGQVFLGTHRKNIIDCDLVQKDGGLDNTSWIRYYRASSPTKVIFLFQEDCVTPEEIKDILTRELNSARERNVSVGLVL